MYYGDLVQQYIAQLHHVSQEREQRRLAEHEQQVNFWRQRQSMHDQMLERIKQAKTNFLDITAEMLDSTVHSTILENQRLADELAVQSTQIEKLIRSNEELSSEKRCMAIVVRLIGSLVLCCIRVRYGVIK